MIQQSEITSTILWNILYHVRLAIEHNGLRGSYNLRVDVSRVDRAIATVVRRKVMRHASVFVQPPIRTPSLCRRIIEHRENVRRAVVHTLLPHQSEITLRIRQESVVVE